MKNDLISREALKKAFEDTMCIEPMPYAFVKQIIDNAPTVEERPKGKWIYNDLGYLICSNCDYECLYDEEGLYSLGCYCHHCGAYMRGDDYGS